MFARLKWVRVAAVVVGLQAAGRVDAAIVVELEDDGTAVNNTLDTAQAIPPAAFTPNVDPNVFGNLPTATVRGFGGGGDVDFFSFQAGPGIVYLDIDNDPATFDTFLSLFDANGTLLALNDDSPPEDPGTALSLDAFVGAFILPSAGTYYVAVSSSGNLPTGQQDASDFTVLFRPDGGFGGVAVGDAAVGDSTFFFDGPQEGAAYTLSISVAAVPEPASVVLLGVGAAGPVVRRVRRPAR